jgi:hypothetical protein
VESLSNHPKFDVFGLVLPWCWWEGFRSLSTLGTLQ